MPDGPGQRTDAADRSTDAADRSTDIADRSPEDPGHRAGLVLAGGHSTRFGSADKAFAELGGIALIGHVLARVNRTVDGHLRPTVAVYRTTAMRGACERTIAAGDGSLRDAVGTLDVAIIPEDTVVQETEPSSLLDVNTPADLDRMRDSSDG